MFPRPSHRLLGLALVVAAASSLATHAFAQAVPQGTTVDVGAAFTDVRGTLEAVLGVAVAAIAGLVAWGVKRLVGVTLDAKMTTLLHDTLMRGVHYGLDTVGKDLSGRTVDVRSTVIAQAIVYARTYRPKILAHFKLTDDAIADLLKVHLAKLLPAGATL